jgi:hypothetical protein
MKELRELSSLLYPDVADVISGSNGDSSNAAYAYIHTYIHTYIHILRSYSHTHTLYLIFQPIFDSENFKETQSHWKCSKRRRKGQR